MLQCATINVQRQSMLELGVKFLLSYFAGSVMGSLVVGALYGGVDIRTEGSGNPGGTNALRTHGWLFALGVVIIDVGKGALAAGVIPSLSIPLPADDPQIPDLWLTYCCASAAVIGHVWPIWYGFQGGKAAATLVGTIAVLSSSLLIPVLLVWILFLVQFGYVGLATMAAGLSAPIYLALTRLPADQPLFVYTLFCGLFLIYTHRSNIQRMLDGTENKNTRVMIFHRGRSH